ncbi:tryptophan--tRNA ligase [Candidatus Woesearchaeota archaeon]|nr:tryptophan--tRNA ligase [Candidatus Woesearchaeota archaeon]
MEIMKEAIDPWKSVIIKDYDKAITELGIEPISTILKKLPQQHHYFTRHLVFGHKSLQIVLEAVKQKKPFVMMTGLMPSGKFHFGHKIIADLMLYFQSLGAECYITVADIESYLMRNIPLAEARKIAIEEYLINYIALGLQPRKTTFYFQSEGPKSYMNLSKFVAKKTTLNELKDIYGEMTTDKLIAVLTQIADILHPQLDENDGPKPTVVPVGVDQLPHINLSRDIATRFKAEYRFIQPSAIFSKMLPGLKGGKMSSSDPDSAIFLTDTPETVAKKIHKYAFSGGQATIEEHRKKGGNPDIDICYQWLTFLEEDDKKLEKIYNDYKTGKLLTSELKEITIKKINMFLKEHQKKREQAKKKINQFIYKN